MRGPALIGLIEELRDYGIVVEKFEYDVYVKTITRAPSYEQLAESKYDNPYMFTGRRFDTETVLEHQDLSKNS